MWSSALKSFSSNISSHYKLSEQPTCISGPWRIFDAKNKSTGKQVSVFVFDRKSLEPNSAGLTRSSATSIKKAQDEVVERLKKEASSLARLRHPSVLELVEPVEDTRGGGLMFATEQVTGSLGTLLKDKDETERAGGRYVEDSEGHRRRRETEMDQLEIQKGLEQIGKGLEFLHESAGLVHGNLTPEAVFVNAKSDWKLSGLGFSGKSENSNAASSAAPIALSEVLNHDPRLPPFVQLNIDYTSPDFVMDSSVSPAADMFSLGLLIVALYNSPHKSPFQTNQSLSTYKRLFTSSSTTPSGTNNYLSATPLPKDVVALLQRLITRKPSVRLSARDFQSSPFFDNILNSTIRFLESLPAKTPNEKSTFLRGLPRILNQFPKTVLEKKVLPALLEEMKDKELIALVLQNVFKMVEIMPHGRRAFSEKIIPKLREIFLDSAPKKTKDANQEQAADKDTAKAAGLMILLERVNIIAENTNGKEFEESIWPIIRLSMESSAHALTDAALRTLPVMLNVLDFPTIKNDVFPVISTVFSKTNSLGIKIRGLEALQILCGGTSNQDESSFDDGLNGFAGTESSKPKKNSAILDKYTIQEKVVPLLKAIKTKEPAVMMAALDVFQEVGKIADSDFLASDVMPILWTFSLGPLLNLSQFQAYVSLINTYTNRIVQEQTRKLQELSATQVTSAHRNDLMTFAGVSQPNGLENGQGVGEADFENLVLGRTELHSGNKTSFENTFEGLESTTVTTSPSIHSPRANIQPSPATFSWSTPSPENTIQPPLSSFRTITPDQSLNAFASLQPSSTTTTNAFSQPLQLLQPPKPSSTATFAPAQSANPWTSSSTTSVGTSGNIDWSSAAGGTSSNVWASSQPTRPSSNPTFGAQSSLNSVPLRPTPNSSAYSGFNIAPPPVGVAKAGTLQGNQLPRMQQPSGSGPKTGLDKYESLL